MTAAAAHCTDGATDAEHDAALALTGQCPYCGVEDGE